MNSFEQKQSLFTTSKERNSKRTGSKIPVRSKSTRTRRTISTKETPKKRSQSTTTNKSIRIPLPAWVTPHLRYHVRIHFLEEDSPNHSTFSTLVIPKNRILFFGEQKEKKNETSYLSTNPKSELEKVPKSADRSTMLHSSQEPLSEISCSSLSSLTESEELSIMSSDIRPEASKLTRMVLQRVREEHRPSKEFNLEERIFRILKLGEERTYSDIKNILGVSECCKDEGKLACFGILCENVKIY